jgi:hypothetical protein
MKLLDEPKVTASSDPYYDLFEGGYLDPEEFLVEEDAKKVREAMAVIEEFFMILENNELLEEM